MDECKVDSLTASKSFTFRDEGRWMWADELPAVGLLNRWSLIHRMSNVYMRVIRRDLNIDDNRDRTARK